ncbi:hypothetical protein GGR53DRAFT_527732 [Hypoxylon sp. FL1150]|nr:hypothetical protein GGR53DRAFT_527732 [Hypoxylon sp. FL1150]
MSGSGSFWISDWLQLEESSSMLVIALWITALFYVFACIFIGFRTAKKHADSKNNKRRFWKVFLGSTVIMLVLAIPIAIAGYISAFVKQAAENERLQRWCAKFQRKERKEHKVRDHFTQREHPRSRHALLTGSNLNLLTSLDLGLPPYYRNNNSSDHWSLISLESLDLDDAATSSQPNKSRNGMDLGTRSEGAKAKASAPAPTNANGTTITAPRLGPVKENPLDQPPPLELPPPAFVAPDPRHGFGHA